MADHKAPAFASAPTDLGFHHRCLAANVDVVKDLALKYPMSTHTEVKHKNEVSLSSELCWFLFLPMLDYTASCL